MQEVDVDFVCFFFQQFVGDFDVGCLQVGQVLFCDQWVGVGDGGNYVCYVGVYQCIGIGWGVVEMVVWFQCDVDGGIMYVLFMCGGVGYGLDFGVVVVGWLGEVGIDDVLVFDDDVVYVWIGGGVEYVEVGLQ